MSEVNYNNACDSFDSCAIAGAAAFMAGIPNSHILINGPLWCYFYAKGHLKRANSKIMERFTASQPDTNAVIFGGESFLKEELERLCGQENFNPSVLFVENSCAFSLIGDDTEGILREQELPFPCVSMDCGGLMGNFAAGYEKAFIECIKVLGLKREKRDPLGVNLLGTTEYYLHGKADKEEMVRLLELCGYKVEACPGSGTTWEGLQGLSKASLNIVVNEELGLKSAQLLQKQLGIPYIVAGLPYGLKGTKKWLERINEALPVPGLDSLSTEIEEVQKVIIDTLEDYSCYWGALWYDQVIVAAPSTQALAMAEALRTEWMDMGKLTVLGLTEVKDKSFCTCLDELIVVDKAMTNWKDCISKHGSVLLLGSNNEQVNILREGLANIDFLNIAYPLHQEVVLVDMPLVGIKGTPYFLQLLWNKFMQTKVGL